MLGGSGCINDAPIVRGANRYEIGAGTTGIAACRSGGGFREEGAVTMGPAKPLSRAVRPFAPLPCSGRKLQGV